jgi:hypothetical protein
MGLPPFSLALAGKTGPATMIASAVEDVNPESYGSLLYELVFDPPSQGRQWVERLSADVDAGQVMPAFEILDDVAGIGAVAHVRDPQEVHQLGLDHELGKANCVEFFVHNNLPGG